MEPTVGMRTALWSLGLVACSVGLAPAAQVVTARGTGDGQEVYRLPVVLAAPADEALRIEGGTVLSWNRSGRLFRVEPFDAQEFASWAGRRVGLRPGQEVLFSRRQTYWLNEEAARVCLVFYSRTAGGTARRLVEEFWLGSAPAEEPAPAPAADTPRFEVRTWPDRLEATRLPRTRRQLWGFELWAQETNGVAVNVTGAEWMAVDREGLTVQRGELKPSSALGPVTGLGTCGPDGFLRLGGERLVDETGKVKELVVSLTGHTADGKEVSALGRFALLPPTERPAKTVLRPPFDGTWQVVVGPGEPPFVGNQSNTWRFEQLGRDGKPYRGDGRRLDDHHSYGQTVVCPAHGTVLTCVDVYPDAATPTRDGFFTGGGGVNYLVLDHGNGEFSYLGGLLQRSSQVVPGMAVETGQPLAQVGNSADPSGRPGLTYRLMHEPQANAAPVALEARFSGYTHLLPGESFAVDHGAPETGDIIRVP